MPAEIYQRLASRAGARFTLLRQFGTTIVLLLTIWGLNYLAPAHSTLTERLYASLMLAILAIPLWLWRLGIDCNPPFIVLVTLVYFLMFGSGVFILESFQGNVYTPDVSPRWVEAALRLSLVGMVCMLAGYYALTWMPTRSLIPRFRMKWSNTRAVRWTGLAMSVGGLLFSVIRIPGLPESLGQVVVYAQATCTAGVCILIGLWWLGRLSHGWIFLLFAVLVPMRIGVELLHGGSGGAITITFTLILIFAALSHRIAWPLIFAGIAAIFVIRPLEMPYRVATWYPQSQLHDASAAQKAEYFGHLVYQATIGGDVSPEVLIQFAGGRLAQFTTFAEVIRDTPSEVPYWKGKTYIPILFKPIPRLIYPDKPEEVTGSQFGHRYGFSNVASRTSINLPQMVELYANFGSAGVIIGMILIGMIYRVLLEMFMHPEMGFGAMIAGVCVVSNLFDIGAGTSMVFGAIPWSMVFVGVMNVIVVGFAREERAFNPIAVAEANRQM